MNHMKKLEWFDYLWIKKLDRKRSEVLCLWGDSLPSGYLLFIIFVLIRRQISR